MASAAVTELSACRIFGIGFTARLAPLRVSSSFIQFQAYTRRVCVWGGKGARGEGGESSESRTTSTTKTHKRAGRLAEEAGPAQGGGGGRASRDVALGSVWRGWAGGRGLRTFPGGGAKSAAGASSGDEEDEGRTTRRDPQSHTRGFEINSRVFVSCSNRASRASEMSE